MAYLFYVILNKRLKYGIYICTWGFPSVVTANQRDQQLVPQATELLVQGTLNACLPARIRPYAASSSSSHPSACSSHHMALHSRVFQMCLISSCNKCTSSHHRRCLACAFAHSIWIANEMISGGWLKCSQIKYLHARLCQCHRQLP